MHITNNTNASCSVYTSLSQNDGIVIKPSRKESIINTPKNAGVDFIRIVCDDKEWNGYLPTNNMLTLSLEMNGVRDVGDGDKGALQVMYDQRPIPQLSSTESFTILKSSNTWWYILIVILLFLFLYLFFIRK